MWTQRLTVCLYVALQLGLFVNGECSLVVDAESRDADADIEKTSTVLDRDQVRKAQQSCKNTFEFACTWLHDREIYRKNVVICAVSMVVQRWHQEQVKCNRSALESAHWHTARALDCGIPHLNELIQLLADGGLLLKLGLDFGSSSKRSKVLPIDHPLVNEQTELVSTLADFVMAVASKRARTMLWFQTFPHRFAGLLCEDLERRNLLVRAIEEEYLLWVEVDTRQGAFWQRMQERSPLRCVHTKLTLQLLSNAGWSVSERLYAHLQQQWRGISQTKLIEDGIRDERVGEQRSSFNRISSGETTWQRLLEAQTESKKHRFERVPWEETVVPRGLAQRSVASLFRVRPQTVPSMCRQIVSQSRGSAFYSPSPLRTASLPREDIELLKALRMEDKLDMAPHSWWSTLLRSKRLLVRHPTYTKNKWVLSMGCVGGSCGMGWPVQAKIIKSEHVYVPSRLEDFVWLPVVDPESWTSMTVEWKSPLYIKLWCGRWAKSGVMLWPTSEAGSLLRVSAENGFWDIPKSGLVKIAGELGIPLVNGRSLTNVLFDLVAGVLKRELDEDTKLRLLRLRMPESNPAADILETAGDELIDEKEKQELRKQAQHDAADPEVASAVRQMASEGSRRRDSELGVAASSSASSAAGAAKRKRRYPPTLVVPETDIPKACADLLPSSCKIYADAIDMGWRLEAYGKRYSKAWRLYGKVKAAELLIAIAWERAVKLGHEASCPFPTLNIA
eukprot:2399239-Amphidinium_carterae.2